MSNEKEFCRFLKNGLVYNNNQDTFSVSPCCYFSQSFLLDNKKSYNQQFKELRKIWIESDVEKTCKICINLENASGWSYRKSSFDTVVGDSDAIEFLTVAVNKQCNLACASCNSRSSSFWYQENIRNNVIQPTSIHQMHRNVKDKVTDEDFVSILKTQDLSKLKYIKFGGGEPLMTDTHLNIIELVPNPANVVIQYTSNFSIAPSNRVLRAWEKFKLVKWFASIDGTESQFEILRWPMTWKKLETSVTDAIKNSPHNTVFGIEHTLNPLNIFYYDRIENWKNQVFATNRYGDKTDFMFHACTGVIGLEHTPPMLREKVIEKYGNMHPISTFLKKYPYSGNVKGLINHMNQLDQWRNTNWRQEFKDVEGFFQ